MTRVPPYECPHGKVLDWGDYGPGHWDGIWDGLEPGLKDRQPQSCLECLELKEQGPVPVMGAPDFGKAICEHLGLDPEWVRNIDLHIRGRGVVTATVEHIIAHPGQTEPIQSELKSYMLVDREVLADMAKAEVAVGMKSALTALLNELKER